MEQMELTQEEIIIVKQMIQERLSRDASPRKIHLKRDLTSTKSVRIPTRMLEMVMAKGENFSSLVERLLFEYLGRPDELLE